jgi:(1->4)-alpha-D-glucan 1-alpha-D-glucosylmutase
MERLPYLEKLGVSHLYLSPVLQAGRGSQHGYDLVDPTRISDELGGRAGFDQLVESAHAHGLGLILDIVPNHMSISDPRNAWWWDVLEYGPRGRWAHAFDVDWNAPEPGLKDVVLLPVLSDHRHRVLKRGEVTVARAKGRFVVRYEDQLYPLTPKSIAPLLREAAALCNNARVAFFADAYEQLAQHDVVADLLEELLDKSPMCSAALDARLEALNKDAGRLEHLLAAQHYRLAYWRRAERDLDYRRFFDVNSLVGLRIEDPRVFDASHGLIEELARVGAADGLRVDHVDGLANPRAYLERLAGAVDVPVWVEKILAAGETLPGWPVAGTTGYDFAADVCALFIPPEAEEPLTALQRELGGGHRPFADVSSEARAQVLDELLQSDLNRLTATLVELRERHDDISDFSRHELRALVRALAASFPVYRTYLERGRDARAADVAHIEEAVAAARARFPEVDGALYDFAAEVLLGKRDGPQEREWVEHLQQLCAPAMAKGVEDTALYRDVRLLALDEVGSSPARFSLPVADFHARQLEAQAKWPLRLNALSTHDSKRSADVRARLVAMAQAPHTFSALARDFFGMTDSGVDGPTRLLALQTLVGAWPLDLERFQGVLLKSVREAKQHTRWTRPNEAYEARLLTFAREVLESDSVRALLARYVSALEPQARALSLAWTLLQCTCPGVPDVYQGTELWAHLLVDPDNRRPVDWNKRDHALEEKLPALEADELGLAKLHVIRRSLALRRRYPHLFESYQPLQASGAHADEVIAYARGGGAVAVAPLRPVAHWGDTRVTLPEGAFESLLISDGRHQGEVRLAALFEALPVALLKMV